MSSITNTAPTAAPVANVTGGLSYATTSASQLNNAAVTLTDLQADAASISARAALYANVQQSLVALQAATLPLENGTQVGGLSVSDNSSAITATLGSNAVAGSYNVTVSRLAQAQVNTSANSATSTAAAGDGSGTLGIKVGNGSTTNINITATMSLTDITNAINNAKAGVTAQLGGSTGAYNIVVTGNLTGAANAVTFTQSGVTLNFASTQNQAALDSNYTINGQSYTSTYNTAAYGIPGVSMAFSGLATNATVTVGASGTAVQSAVGTLVSSYNAALTAVQTALSSDTLSSDPTLLGIRQQLMNLTGNVVSGSRGTYNSLAGIGVRLNTDDTLIVNSNVLASSASTDAGSISALVAGNSSGATGLAAGLYQIAQTFAEPGVGTLPRIANRQSLQLLRLTRSEAVQQSFVDTSTALSADQYTQLQITLSQLNARSMVVQTLTASLGLQFPGGSSGSTGSTGGVTGG